MPLYYYRAKSGPDKLVEGEIEAPDQETALKRIEEKGFFPIKLEEKKIEKRLPSKLTFKKINPRKITVFSRELSILLKSGVPILKALEFMGKQTEDKVFKTIIKGLYSDVKEGESFSSALSKYPKVFSPLYISMVKAGEDSGRLEEVLNILSFYRQQREDLISKTKVALIYPLIMLVVGIFTVIFMLTFVMPRLMNIFSQLGTQLPLPTRMIIYSSEFLKEKWLILVIIFVFFIFIYLKGRNRPQIRWLLSKWKLKTPFIKKFVLSKEIAHFSRTFEVLIRSGVSILKALELSIPVLNNEIIKQEFLKSAKDLKEGGSLGDSLKKSKIFAPFMVSLISIGEESGKLDQSLSELANIYEKNLEETIKVFLTFLEPMMILIMGGLIGFIVMATLLPIFQINIMLR
jgi:type IV pilus assembly protein PilC